MTLPKHNSIETDCCFECAIDGITHGLVNRPHCTHPCHRPKAIEDWKSDFDEFVEAHIHHLFETRSATISDYELTLISGNIRHFTTKVKDSLSSLPSKQFEAGRQAALVEVLETLGAKAHTMDWGAVPKTIHCNKCVNDARVCDECSCHK